MKFSLTKSVAGAVFGAGLLFSGTAGAVDWKMATPWGGGVLLEEMKQLAVKIKAATEGRVNITVFPAGTFGKALKVTDSVKSGVAQVGHNWMGYDWGIDKTTVIFGGYVGGLNEEEFFLWLRRADPDVLVINSAGNGSAHSSRDDYRLPSSFITEQLLVVGGHERNDKDVSVEHPDYVRKRKSSNVDMRVDITAAACTRAATLDPEQRGDVHCGTSYATPLVAGAVAAMLSVNPELTPDQVRELLRRSAMTIGRDSDGEPAEADDLTAPILPSERGYRLDDNDVGRSARLDMRKALELTVKSLENPR